MRIITVNGRISADVTRQVSKSGNEFISFSLANNEFGDEKDTDGKPITQWFRVTSFLPQHMSLAQHLKKGKPITVVGKYSNRLYQSQTTGKWGISNDIIASEIAFEIGSERQNMNGASQVATQSNPNTVGDEIPQATSRQMGTPQVATVQTVQSSADDDDLPF